VAVEARDGGVAVVRLAGRLDFQSAPDAKQELVDAVAAGSPKLVVDLAAVEFLDSSGLGALIAGLKAARAAGGDLRLAGVPEQARVVLSLTTMDRMFAAHASVAEAVAGY
jgi:anti-sigma B factor antagonist